MVKPYVISSRGDAHSIPHSICGSVQSSSVSSTTSAQHTPQQTDGKPVSAHDSGGGGDFLSMTVKSEPPTAPMSDVKDITRDLDRLDAQLDDLEEALGLLLDDIQAKASQLPLLDRSKLFSLSAYAIESLLFAYLRLQGADTQDHAVMTELKRVQQYFAKIKAAEEPEAKRTLTINREAAARMLKADLADNKSLSSKLAEKIAEERAKALLKSVEGKKRSVDDSAPSTGSGTEEQAGSKKKKKHQPRDSKKKAKKH